MSSSPRHREWSPALRSAGIAHRPVKTMRHTFASWSTEAGVELSFLARIMGTSVRELEDTYFRFMTRTDDQLRAAFDAYDQASASIRRHLRKWNLRHSKSLCPLMMNPLPSEPKAGEIVPVRCDRNSLIVGEVAKRDGPVERVEKPAENVVSRRVDRSEGRPKAHMCPSSKPSTRVARST